jgi:hypothetical protein
MLRIAVINLLALLFNTALFATTTLTQAVDSKSISLSAIKNGEAFDGKGLTLTLKNNTDKKLSIIIDPALIFQPVDSSFQDLAIIGDETIVLGAHEQQTISLQSFCAKSYAMSPDTGLVYNSYKEGSTNLKKLMHYIQVNHIESSLAQLAVWAITNSHSPGSIYDAANPTQSVQLASYVASLLLTNAPEIFTTHRIDITPNKIAYNPRPLKMFAKFEYIAESDQILTLGVYKEDGTTIESVFENKPFGKGGHRFTVEFEAEDAPKGKYYIRLSNGNGIIKEQEVTIE